jgi:hypothetical protein
VTITDFLRLNELALFHDGHGYYNGEFPVMFAELDRLDREFEVAAVIEVPPKR